MLTASYENIGIGIKGNNNKDTHQNLGSKIQISLNKLTNLFHLFLIYAEQFSLK